MLASSSEEIQVYLLEGTLNLAWVNFYLPDLFWLIAFYIEYLYCTIAFRSPSWYTLPSILSLSAGLKSLAAISAILK